MTDSKKKAEIESEPVVSSSDATESNSVKEFHSIHPVIIQFFIAVIGVAIILLLKFVFPDTFKAFCSFYTNETEKSVMADSPNPSIIYERE